MNVRDLRWLSLVGAGLCACATFVAGGTSGTASGDGRVIAPFAWMAESRARLVSDLSTELDVRARARLERGLVQVTTLWRAEDGGPDVFEELVRVHFARDEATLDLLFARFERLLEQLHGHLHEIGRELSAPADLEMGPRLPCDDLFSAYDPSAHVDDDFFANKLAFVVLLNFPVTTLEERLENGSRWSRREWAEARLAQRFSRRVPADVQLARAEAQARAGSYIAGYNVWMHHVVDDAGHRLFPPGIRLLSHWNLRDEIKACYADPDNGLAKQRTLEVVMERIVTQTIPAVVIDNPTVDWNPRTNDVRPSPVDDADRAPAPGADASNAPEPHTRYARWLDIFRAARAADPYSPTSPTQIARSFDEGRELPEARVRSMLEAVSSSPLVPEVARLIEARLGRPLEPFDIWYDGFRERAAYPQAQLDERVAARYPTAAAYEADIPNLLVKLGFERERADTLAANIVVDPARGSGHALGAQMRGAKAHLRTRVEKGGMNYKGYNIAVHEMGHNVEQTFSMNDIDHWLLEGVPNTSFTEALAFVFQNQDLELLGLSVADEQSRAMAALRTFWQVYEIAGVALVDIAAWHWLYEHPEATPAELEKAVIEIAKDVWNRYQAPVFGRRDVVLLGIYSHMIQTPLYLPDYPLGHLIAFQIEEEMRRAGNLGREFERVAKIGRVTPDLWMEKAVGSAVGPEALLDATAEALRVIDRVERP